MIKKASCENNEVFLNGEKLENIKILSIGKKKTEGFLVIEKDENFYLTLPMESIEKILEKMTDTLNILNNMINKITLLSLGTPTTGWSTPPTLPTDLAEISSNIVSLKNDINNIKENLE